MFDRADSNDRRHTADTPPSTPRSSAIGTTADRRNKSPPPARHTASAAAWMDSSPAPAAHFHPSAPSGSPPSPASADNDLRFPPATHWSAGFPASAAHTSATPMTWALAADRRHAGHNSTASAQHRASGPPS